MIKFFAQLFARRNPPMSNVYLYFVSHDTRRMETPRMDDKSQRKFLKHMFKSYDLKFVEIDGKPFFARGNNVESL